MFRLTTLLSVGLVLCSTAPALADGKIKRGVSVRARKTLDASATRSDRNESDKLMRRVMARGARIERALARDRSRLKRALANQPEFAEYQLIGTPLMIARWK